MTTVDASEPASACVLATVTAEMRVASSDAMSSARSLFVRFTLPAADAIGAVQLSVQRGVRCVKDLRETREATAKERTVATVHM